MTAGLLPLPMIRRVRWPRSRPRSRRWWRTADPKTVQSEQDGKGGVIAVVALGGEQEDAQLRAVETTSTCGVDLRAPHVLGRARRSAAGGLG